MVLISSKKYACETCIKGHRSSACKHTDRPLFEIKKKGRPVTQCEHCRELRKTKQVHIKCVCELKSDDHVDSPSSSKKGNPKIPESATFPNGLPEALEASVAYPSGEGVSSDSDHGAGNSAQCLCETGPCPCWSPRKNAPRRKKRTAEGRSSESIPSHDLYETTKSRAPSHILARVAELRPVLPRPLDIDPSTPLSQPPSATLSHGHSSRPHDSVLFSPYGRAYDRANYNLTNSHDRLNELPNNPSTSMTPGLDLELQPTMLQDPNWTMPSFDMDTATGTGAFPSACGCGDSCQCPGCIHHNGSSVQVSSFSTCTNPAACTTCLDCTLLSLPTPLPTDSPLTMYDPYQTAYIDEWLRQVSSLPPTASSAPPSVADDMMNTDDTQRTVSFWGQGQDQDGNIPDFVFPPSTEDRDFFPRRGELSATHGLYLSIPDPSSRSLSPNSSTPSVHDQGFGDETLRQDHLAVVPGAELFGTREAVRSAPQLRIQPSIIPSLSYASSTPSISQPPSLSDPISKPGSNSSFDDLEVPPSNPPFDRLRIC